MSRHNLAQQCGLCDQQSLRYVQSDQSLCLSLEYSMSVKLLKEQHLEFLSLKGGCTRACQNATLVELIFKSLYVYRIYLPRSAMSGLPGQVCILSCVFMKTYPTCKIHRFAYFSSYFGHTTLRIQNRHRVLQNIHCLFTVITFQNEIKSPHLKHLKLDMH